MVHYMGIISELHHEVQSNSHPERNNFNAPEFRPTLTFEIKIFADDKALFYNIIKEFNVGSRDFLLRVIVNIQYYVLRICVKALQNYSSICNASKCRSDG